LRHRFDLAALAPSSGRPKAGPDLNLPQRSGPFSIRLVPAMVTLENE
jgi:hypothetical protein